MKPVAIDLKKPIKLKINCERFAERQNDADPLPNHYDRIVKSIEYYVMINSALPADLTAKTLEFLKENKSDYEIRPRSFMKMGKISRAESQENERVNDLTRSLFEKPINYNKDNIIGRIKLKKIVNNQKIDVGECQEAAPISNKILVHNMRDKLQQWNDER